MNPDPDPELEAQLTDDIAVEAATEGEGSSVKAEDADDGDEEADEMEEAQEDAAEERKEGGYQ
jgi:hypothetical protein